MTRWQKNEYGQAKEDREIAAAKIAQYRRWNAEGRLKICPTCGGELDVCYSCVTCGAADFRVRIPEPDFRYRVALGVVLDVVARNEVAAGNGFINLLVERLPELGITKRGVDFPAGYSDDNVRRVLVVEVSLLSGDGCDITETKGDKK